MRVFQLYMKSKADMTYYQKADVIKSANDCHNEQHLLKEANLGYFYANEDCFLRDVMTAEDHDSYEKWFGTFSFLCFIHITN